MTEPEWVDFREALSNIFSAGSPLRDSKLVCLSNLNREQLELFKENWVTATTERQLQIVKALLRISEDNLQFDFDNIFCLGLSDQSEKVRLESLSGLEGAEDPVFIDPVVRVLKDDPSEEVRAAAAVVLGCYALAAELGQLPARHGKTIFIALKEVLDTEREVMGVKRRALEAIAAYSVPEVRDYIYEAYASSDVDLKASAVFAMGRNCDPEWLPTIITEMGSTEAQIRYEAANATGEMEDEEAVPHLINLLRDDDEQVQLAAIRALGQIGGEEAKETLEALVGEGDQKVQKAAAAALEELLFWEEPLGFKP